MDAGPPLEPEPSGEPAKIPERHYLFAKGLPTVTGTAPHQNLTAIIEAYGWEAPAESLDLANLDWYYQWLLQDLAYGESWPARVDRKEAIFAFHDYPVRAGYEPAERARAADQLSMRLVHSVRFIVLANRQEIAQALLDSAVESFGLDALGMGLLYVERASLARFRDDARQAQLEVTEGLAALERLARRPDQRALARRTEASLLLEEASQCIRAGLPDEAYPRLNGARELALGLDHYGLSFDVTFDRMNVAIALDREDDLRAAHSEFLLAIEEKGWKSHVRPGELARLTARLGVGLAEAARIAGVPSPEAEERLMEAIATPELIAQDQALCLYWLADLQLDRGALQLAEQSHSRLSALHASGAFLPARTIGERIGLEARLAAAGRLPVEVVLDRAETELNSARERWTASDSNNAGRGLATMRDQLGLLEAVTGLHVFQGDESAALAAVARFGEPGSLARLLDSAPWDPSTLQALTPESGGLMVMVPGGAQSWIFLIDRDGVEAVPAASSRSIDRARKSFEQALKRLAGESRAMPKGHYADVDDGLNAALSKIAAALDWSRCSSRLDRWKRVTIVGADGTGCPPLDLMPLPDGQPLGARLEVSYLPSLVVGQALLRRQPVADAASPAGLVVIDAVTASIDDTPTLAHSLLDPFPGQPVELLRGQTAGSLSGRSLGDRATLTFLGHGVDSGKLDRWVSLLLQPGPPQSLWSPADIEAMPSADYVELIACGTWKGHLRRGDDGRHYLYGSFLRAGASTVLTSREPLVADIAVPEVASLHRHLARTGRPAEALLRMRQQAPKEHGIHPYLLQLVGLDHSLPAWRAPQSGLPKRDVETKAIAPLAWWGGGLILFGLLAFLASRHSV